MCCFSLVAVRVSPHLRMGKLALTAGNTRRRGGGTRLTLLLRQHPPIHTARVAQTHTPPSPGLDPLTRSKPAPAFTSGTHDNGQSPTARRRLCRLTPPPQAMPTSSHTHPPLLHTHKHRMSVVRVVLKNGQELDAPVDAALLLPSSLLAGMLDDEEENGGK